MNPRSGYVAHPYGLLTSNLLCGERWFDWARMNHPSIDWSAPWVWIAHNRPEWSNAQALAWCCARVRCCDVLLLTGRWVSPGMQVERRAAVGRDVLDITGRVEPPTGPHPLLAAFEREGA